MSEIFISGFADHILDYLDYYEESGYKRSSIIHALKIFDDYCYEKYGDEAIFTLEDAVSFYKVKPDNMSSKTFYARTGTLHSFTGFLLATGHKVGIIQQVGRYNEHPFIPHIYTPEEKLAYAAAADLYKDPHHPFLYQLLPVMVRTLQCCGLRVSELLNIRKGDVYIENVDVPYLFIRKSKNGQKRYCPLSDSLAELYSVFHSVYIKLLCEDDDYIFVDGAGKPITHRFLYEIHKDLLYLAGIRYDGDGKGPRLHDWRHTFCIESFQQLLEKGLEERNALMYVSAMMGHSHFSATERYLRLTKAMFPKIAESLDKIYANVGN